jgi:hypothetical protein
VGNGYSAAKNSSVIPKPTRAVQSMLTLVPLTVPSAAPRLAAGRAGDFDLVRVARLVAMSPA